MKYQAHIRYINGDIITVIWDDDLDSFLEEVELARRDIVAYLGESDFEEYNDNNDNYFIEIVTNDHWAECIWCNTISHDSMIDYDDNGEQICPECKRAGVMKKV